MPFNGTVNFSGGTKSGKQSPLDENKPQTVAKSVPDLFAKLLSLRYTHGRRFPLPETCFISGVRGKEPYNEDDM